MTVHKNDDLPCMNMNAQVSKGICPEDGFRGAQAGEHAMLWLCMCP